MTTRTEQDLRAAYSSPPDGGTLDRLNRIIDHLVELPTTKARGHGLVRRLAPLGAAAAVLGLAIVLSVTGSNDGGNSRGPAGGPTLPSAESSPSSTAPAQAGALALWADFPVAAVPRPLVLTGPALTEPASGYPSDVDKIAFSSGNIVLATSLPSSPPTADGQPIMAASDALALLQAGEEGGGPKSGPALQITNVQLAASTFSTDRGPQMLPSWAFTFAGVADPANVLAIPAADRWPHTGTPTSNPLQLAVTIAPNDHEITVSFFGAGPESGPCKVNYQADVVQSASAIMVSIHEVNTNGSTAPGTPSSGSTMPGCALAMAYQRTLTVPIVPAIGNRVLIDKSGAPLPIKAG